MTDVSCRNPEEPDMSDIFAGFASLESTAETKSSQNKVFLKCFFLISHIVKLTLTNIYAFFTEVCVF